MSVSALVRSIREHPGNEGRRVRSIAAALAWQVHKRLLRSPRDIAFHGARLRCYPDSPACSGAIYFGGLPDWWEMLFLKRYLRPGDGFIDIGANVGLYSVLAAACVGPTGRIDAFEPDERSAGRLREQARINGFNHLHIHRMAVTDTVGEVDFGWSDNDAMAHVRRGDEPHGIGRRVPATTLDAVEPYGPYAAGKMDIEGAEPMALAGAAARLRRADPPVWLIELAGYSRYYGVESHEIVERLANAGFDCAVYHPRRVMLEYTSRPWELGAQNVLAIARPHRALVAERLRGDTAPHP